jgi:CO/xanthine dehydrogenase FAD-binding subunit
MPYVAQFACAPYRPLGAAADPDLGLWRRSGSAVASWNDQYAAAETLVGGPGSEEAIAAAAEKVPESLPEAMGDGYASGEYRTHLAGVLAKRALTEAFERAA